MKCIHSTCNKPCLWVHTFFELNMLHTNQIINNETKEKKCTGNHCTLIHEWNVRAFRCTMDRLDDEKKKKEWRKKVILYWRAHQPECYCYLSMCWVVYFSSFGSFSIFRVKFKWLVDGSAGRLCMYVTHRQSGKYWEELFIFYPFSRFNCRSALALFCWELH